MRPEDSQFLVPSDPCRSQAHALMCEAQAFLERVSASAPRREITANKESLFLLFVM